jgi:hypothetical protein
VSAVWGLERKKGPRWTWRGCLYVGSQQESEVFWTSGDTLK